MHLRNLALVTMAGLGIAVPATLAQPQILSPRSSPTSYLGIMMQEVNGDRAKELRLPEEEGVEITVVEPNSPASMAGLMVGDVVVQYNGERVEGMEQFSRMVRETPAGRDVRLQIYRNGTPQTVTAKIGSRTAAAFPAPFAAPANPRELRGPLEGLAGRGPLGIEAEPVSGQLADYFGVRDGGVLVRSVTRNSSAEKAGIKAGDVITRVNDTHVASPFEITTRIRATRGQSVSVTLMRDHREMTLTVPLDADGSQRF